MSNQNISVVITAYNEEKNIKEAVESAFLLTDSVILIDTESTDKTRKIAQTLGCRVISYPYTIYVEPVRQFSIKKASSEWVFILDADERITKDLADEILRNIKNAQHSHFKVKRKNIFAKKKWLKYGGWYPDYIIRLINTKLFKDWPSQIHSTPLVDGKLGHLNNSLIHLFHPSLENMVSKTLLFESIESQMLYEAHRKTGIGTFFRKFVGEFYRRMLKNLGFFDGIYGIIESLYQSYSKTITYIMLYERYKKSSTI